MTAHDFSEAVAVLLGMGLCSVVFAAIGFFAIRAVVRKCRIYRLPLYGFFLFRPKALSLPLLALMFGMASGYFEAWTYRGSFKPDFKERWYFAFEVFGYPGDFVANEYRADWQDDEAWDFRSDISVWNGLFWMGMAVAGVAAFRIHDRTCAQSPQRS